jgi:uncharacterized protein YwgA
MSNVKAKKAAGLVRDAGGRIVGRTRLQKVAYLLTVTGLEEGFAFAYKHYGPYSEELATATNDLITHHCKPSWRHCDLLKCEQIGGVGDGAQSYSISEGSL